MDNFIGLFEATFAVVLGMGLGVICVIVIAKIVFWFCVLVLRGE